MKNIKLILLKCSLFLIIFFMITAIIGAALGTQRAKDLCNSLALQILWAMWVIALLSGFLFFPKMRKNASLLAIHTGVLLIIIGSILSSQFGHKLIAKITGKEKIPQANMIIFEGQKENRVIIMPGERIAHLPFYIKLTDFKIRYYTPGDIIFVTRNNNVHTIAAIVGNQIEIKNYGIFKITRIFKNFKMRLENGHPVIFDSRKQGENPAVEIIRINPNSQSETYYIFSRYPDFSKAPEDLKIIYYRQIKDFISDVQVIQNEKVILSQSIRVNHPLHFGGYHFYQLSYDEKEEKYTILLVVSDSGLIIVWAGYALLGLGTVWLFYIGNVIFFIRNRGEKNNGN